MKFLAYKTAWKNLGFALSVRQQLSLSDSIKISEVSTFILRILENLIYHSNFKPSVIKQSISWSICQCCMTYNYFQPS